MGEMLFSDFEKDHRLFNFMFDVLPFTFLMCKCGSFWIKRL